MHDGTKNGMLRLLQRKLEPWRRLNVRGTSWIFDVVPRDCVEPLEVHDFFVQAKTLLTTEAVLIVVSGCRSGGLIRVRGKGQETSVSAAAARMTQSRCCRRFQLRPGPWDALGAALDHARCPHGHTERGRKHNESFYCTTVADALLVAELLTTHTAGSTFSFV